MHRTVGISAGLINVNALEVVIILTLALLSPRSLPYSLSLSLPPFVCVYIN